RGQVERVVGFRRVVRLAQRGGVLQCRLGLVVDAGGGGVVRQGQVAVGLLGVDLWRNQRDQLRLQFVELGDTSRDVTQLRGQRVDPVERVEERPQCGAGRDVETVWLPVEVVAHGPEEVVEVGDLVTQVVRRGDRLLER